MYMVSRARPCRATRARRPSACRDRRRARCRRHSRSARCTDWPTSSDGCGGGVARRLPPAVRDERHRDGRARRPIGELHRRRRAEPGGDAAERDRDADRQQVERAGDELGADQHRGQRSTRSSRRYIGLHRGPRRHLALQAQAYATLFAMARRLLIGSRHPSHRRPPCGDGFAL